MFCIQKCFSSCFRILDFNRRVHWSLKLSNLSTAIDSGSGFALAEPKALSISLLRLSGRYTASGAIWLIFIEWSLLRSPITGDTTKRLNRDANATIVCDNETKGQSGKIEYKSKIPHWESHMNVKISELEWNVMRRIGICRNITEKEKKKSDLCFRNPCYRNFRLYWTSIGLRSVGEALGLIRSHDKCAEP